jgi:hypothetical protein
MGEEERILPPAGGRVSPRDGGGNIFLLFLVGMLPSRAYAPGSRNAGSVWAWHGNARRADWPHGQGSGVGAHVRSKRRLVDWWRPGGCPVSCVHEHGVRFCHAAPRIRTYFPLFFIPFPVKLESRINSQKTPFDKFFLHCTVDSFLFSPYKRSWGRRGDRQTNGQPKYS